jgi:hypothetical protein
LPDRDVKVWLGILRQILWKVGSVEKHGDEPS